MSIQQELTKFWLSEKQALIYTTALSLWPCPASTLARHTWLKRSNSYLLLEQMLASGLMWSYSKWDTQYFFSTSPELLVKKQEEKYLHIKNLADDLSDLIPKTRPHHIQHYEWLEQVKQAYLDILTSKESAMSFFPGKIFHAELEVWSYDIFIPLRIENQISVRVIMGTENNIKHTKYHKKSSEYRRYTHIKYTDRYPLYIEGQIYLYWGNKVLVASYSQRELIASMFQSVPLYKSFESIFEYVWNV